MVPTMKILFISDVYFPRINGVSTSIETFRRNLRALGHTVHLIAPDYSAPSPDETDLTRVPSRYLPFDPEDRLMSYGWVMKQLEKLRGEQYDVIHIQTPFVEEYLYHYVPLVPKGMMKSIAKRFSRHQGNS